MKNLKLNLLLSFLLSLLSVTMSEAQFWTVGGQCFGPSPEVFGTTCPDDIQFILNGNAFGSWDQQDNVYFANGSGVMNSGYENTGIGGYVLQNNQGNINVAIGYGCMNQHITGDNNIAMGDKAMADGQKGDENIALGIEALRTNQNSSHNIAIGSEALYSNQIDYEIGIGYYALYNNSTGYGNEGIGVASLYSNTIGVYNTGIGYKSLTGVNSGDENVGLGVGTGSQIVTGSNNTFLGSFADATGIGASAYNNSTALGAGTLVNAANKIRFGNGAVTVIEGNVPYTVSDGRFKKNITETVQGLEFINKLRPVQYNFEPKEFDQFLSKNNTNEDQNKFLAGLDYSAAEMIHYSGFIAQEVEQASKETGYDFNGVHTPENDGDNYSLAYAYFVVPLVKSVQQLSADNDAKDNLISKQQSEIDELNSRITLLEQMVLGKAIPSTVSKVASLGQNQPNPTDRNTVISYFIPENSGDAYISITDLHGKEMQHLQVTQLNNGTITVNTQDLAAGNYIYSLVIQGSTVDSKQMSIVK